MAVQMHSNLLTGVLHGSTSKRKHSAQADFLASCNVNYENDTTGCLPDILIQLYDTTGLDASYNQNDVNIAVPMNDPLLNFFDPGQLELMTQYESRELYNMLEVVSLTDGLIWNNNAHAVDPSNHGGFVSNHESGRSNFHPEKKKLLYHSLANKIYNVADTSDLNPTKKPCCQAHDDYEDDNDNVPPGLIPANNYSWNTNNNYIADQNYLAISQPASLFNTETNLAHEENDHPHLIARSNKYYYNVMEKTGTADYSDKVFLLHDQMQAIYQQSNKLYSSIPSNLGHEIGHHPSSVSNSNVRSLSNSNDYNDMISIHSQDQEIHYVLKLYEEKMRKYLAEQSEKQRRSLLTWIDQRMDTYLIREKEAEIAKICNRNLELHNLVKQLSFESQVWQNVASRDEAIIACLKNHLEQISMNIYQIKEERITSKEGFGENIDALQDMESQMCVHKANIIRDERNYCRICKANSVCILLLPCKHLCLCNECDPTHNNCPLCGETKNAIVQVYME